MRQSAVTASPSLSRMGTHAGDREQSCPRRQIQPQTPAAYISAQLPFERRDSLCKQPNGPCRYTNRIWYQSALKPGKKCRSRTHADIRNRLDLSRLHVVPESRAENRRNVTQSSDFVASTKVQLCQLALVRRSMIPTMI